MKNFIIILIVSFFYLSSCDGTKEGHSHGEGEHSHGTDSDHSHSDDHGHPHGADGDHSHDESFEQEEFTVDSLSNKTSIH